MSVSVGAWRASTGAAGCDGTEGAALKLFPAALCFFATGCSGWSTSSEARFVCIVRGVGGLRPTGFALAVVVDVGATFVAAADALRETGVFFARVAVEVGGAAAFFGGRPLPRPVDVVVAGAAVVVPFFGRPGPRADVVAGVAASFFGRPGPRRVAAGAASFLGRPRPRCVAGALTVGFAGRPRLAAGCSGASESALRLPAGALTDTESSEFEKSSG